MAAMTFFLITLIIVVVQISSAPTPPAMNSTRTAIGNVPTPPHNSPVPLMQAFMSGLSFHISHVLWTKASNSTAMIKLKYPFINKRLRLSPPFIHLGLLSKDIYSCDTMSRKDQIRVLYRQFATFMEPLHLACQYEAAQGSQNADLSSSLNFTRVDLYDAVFDLHRYLKSHKVNIPAVNKITESDLNLHTKNFLTRLQRKNLGVPPTDANVKIYRNYVILDTLVDIIDTLQPCI